MNKEQTAALIDRLADKTLSLGCIYTSGQHGERVCVKVEGDQVYHEWSHCHSGDMFDYKELIEVKGHPIRIGDVLAKLFNAGGYGSGKSAAIIDVWHPCGIDKSVQEIIEASGWEKYAKHKTEKRFMSTGESYAGVTDEYTDEEQLKDPSARALLEELNKLFPKK